MIVNCPFCHRKSEVSVELADGQHVLCAYCKQKFDYHVPDKEPHPVLDFKVGTTIGVYKILRCIGHGGMGAVYEVEHISLGAHFAMKVFTAKSGDKYDDILKQKFLEEAKQLSVIRHANVAHVFDLSVDPETGAPYFVMDLVTYVGGEPCTLNDLDRKSIEEDLIFLWFSDMCKVLDYVHALGIVHRDIKLENILINQDQHVVLTDFGVAKVFGGLMKRAVQGGCESGALDDKNVVFGTPHYMAPEVARGDTVTAAADVYSLGVAFLRLLTGEWYDENPGAIKKLAHRKYDWVSVLAAMLSPVVRRPTKIGDLPHRLSRGGATKVRQVGAWKIMLSQQNKNGRLLKAIEKARRQQEARERNERNARKRIIWIVIGILSVVAVFFTLALHLPDEEKLNRIRSEIKRQLFGSRTSE